MPFKRTFTADVDLLYNNIIYSSIVETASLNLMLEGLRITNLTGSKP